MVVRTFQSSVASSIAISANPFCAATPLMISKTSGGVASSDFSYMRMDA